MQVFYNNTLVGLCTAMKNHNNTLIDILENETRKLSIDLNDNQKRLFNEYATLLLAWNQRASITNLTDIHSIATRLFAESLSLLVALRENQYLNTKSPIKIADIGSGGGFPGIPISIIEPTIEMYLIEAHQRRSIFLNHVVEKLDLENVKVISERIENVGRNPKFREKFDLVVARALAPLNVLTEYALPLTRLNGILATPKGSKAQQEIDESHNAMLELGGYILEPIPLPLPDNVLPQHVILIRREKILNHRYPRRNGIPRKRPL